MPFSMNYSCFDNLANRHAQTNDPNCTTWLERHFIPHSWISETRLIQMHDLPQSLSIIQYLCRFSVVETKVITCLEVDGYGTKQKHQNLTNYIQCITFGAFYTQDKQFRTPSCPQGVKITTKRQWQNVKWLVSGWSGISSQSLLFDQKSQGKSILFAKNLVCVW